MKWSIIIASRNCGSSLIFLLWVASLKSNWCILYFRYEAMSRIYYRGAKAAIVCYDIADRPSWDKADFWINELRRIEEVKNLLVVKLSGLWSDEQPMACGSHIARQTLQYGAQCRSKAHFVLITYICKCEINLGGSFIWVQMSVNSWQTTVDCGIWIGRCTVFFFPYETVYFLYYLFIYALFIDAVKSLDIIASNYGIISENELERKSK